MSEQTIDADFGPPEHAPPDADFGPPGAPQRAEGDALGVVPMPSAAQQQAALATPEADDFRLRAAEGLGAAGNVSDPDTQARVRQIADAIAADASLAAHKALNSGISPEDGAEALQRSAATGLGAGFVAKALPALRAQDAAAKTKAALASAPITASWMNQSPAHAAAAGGDVENLSILEWLAGVRRAPVRPEAVGPYAQAQREHPDLPNTEANPVDSVPAQALAKGALAVKATALGITEGIRRLYQSRNPVLAALTPGRGLVELARATDAALTPEGVQRESTARYGGAPSSSEPQSEDARRADADQAIRETMDAAQIPIEGNEGPVRGAITESVRAVPQMVALMAGGASVLAAQSYGDLHNHFSLAQNPDGSRKYTEDEAQGLASGGAVATSILLSRLGPAFADNTIGKLLPKAAAEGVGNSGQIAFIKNLLDNPSLWRNALGRTAELGEHAIHGAAFMAGQALVNDLTDQTGDVLHGGKYSASRSWDVAKGAAKDSLMLLPLMAIGPVRGIMEDTGRRWNAHQDAVHFASTVETAKNTKIIQTAPEKVQPLVEAQTRQNPERSTAFIPVAAFDAAMRQAGLDPAEVAGSFADQGAAYGEARASGGDFAIPMAEVATKLAPQGLADGLTADVKLRPNGASLREALSIEEARKLYASMPGDADIGLSIPRAADLQEAQARKIYGATGEQATTPDRIRTPEAANPATDPFRAVYEDFKLRALAAGQTEEEADASAKVFTRGMAALARGEGRGRDVRQFAESFPVAIAGPNGESLNPSELRVAADVQAELRQLRLLTPGPRTMEEVYGLLRDHFQASGNAEEANRYEGLRAEAAQESGTVEAHPEAKGIVERLRAMLSDPEKRNATAAVLRQAAYHGTRHAFEKFSLQKIGTGEGEQVYGWGLYFAEKKAVADEYRRMLAATDISVDGKPLPERTAPASTPEEAVHDRITTVTDSLTEFRDGKLPRGYEVLDAVREHIRTELAKEHDPAAQDALREQLEYANKVKRVGVRRGGRTYKVTLPDAHELLDYDKPLSEQPPKVREAIAPLVGRLGLVSSETGGSLYTALSLEANGGPQRASETLRDAGVPGLRYLDQGSRDVGEGTRNFVIWDESRIGEPDRLEQAGRTSASLSTVEDLARERGVDLSVQESSDKIALSKIVVPEAARSSGIGSEILGRLTEYADAAGKMITLDPATDFGATSRARLVRFYKRFGFVENKGRNRDLSISADMYRPPRELFQRHIDLGGSSVTLNDTERGAIRIGVRGPNGERAFRIDLTKPDASTLPHELFHMLSEVMGEVAQGESADPKLKADYDSLLKTMGYDSHEQRQTARDAAKEEIGSHLYEQWLAEGTAPTPELASTFARFKEWLGAIYKGVLGIAAQYKQQYGKELPALTDETRGVFARLLGGDGVAQAEAEVAAEQARTTETPATPREEPLVRVDENHTMTATEFARRRTQSELPLGEVHPARYEQQARSAATEARKHNERAVNALSEAEAHAQEGLEAGSAAAEQARIAARSIAFGMGMQANSDTPRAGMEALKNARGGLRESERGQQGAEDASIRATRAAIAAGDARTKATAAEQQQIVNDRLAAAAREAKAEQKKITGYMKERASEDKRALLLRADQEYGQGSVYTDTHDAIMEALGFREPSGAPKNVDAGIARITADDRLNFDPEALKAILAKPAVRQMGLNEKLKGSLDGLTLDEAKVVRDAIKNIRHAANAAVKVVLAEKQAEYADQVRRLGEFRPEKPPPALPPAGGRSTKGFFEKANETRKSIDAGLLYGDVILREAGPVGEEYAKEELRTHTYLDELSRTVGAEMRKAIDAMPKEVRKHLDDRIEGPPNPVFAADRWTRKDAMMLAAWTGTASSAERAAKGLHLTEEQLHAFLDVLTKPEWDFVQSAIWDVNDRVLKPLLMAHTAKNTGVPMETIEARPVQTKYGEYRGGFHHAAYDFEASQKQAARSQAEMGGIGDNYGDLKKGWAVGVRNGFTKSRAPGFFDVPDLSWGSYPAHINAVLHYLAVDNYVKALAGLLRRGDARAALTRTIGIEKLRKLDSHVEVVARGYAEGPRDGFKEADNFVNGALRSRAAQGIFNFNLKVWGEQFTHPLAAAPTLGLGPRALLVGGAKATFGGMAELARVGAEHIAVGLGEALQPYSWADARDRSAATGLNVLGRRWDNFTEHMRDMYAGVLPSGKKAGPWDIFNWGVQHGIDGFLAQVMWHASEYKARKAGATPEEAALVAEQNTYDAMPRMTAAEGSAYSASRGFIGTYILTKRFAATLFNLHELGTWEQKAKAFDASRGFQRAVGIVGYGMMSVALWQAQTFGAHVVGQFMAGHGAQDNESWIQWLIRKWIEGNGYSIPFGEDVTKPIAEKLVHGKQLRAAIEPPASLRLIEDEINDIGLAIQRGKPVSDRMFAGTRSLLRAVPGGAGFIQPLKLGQAGYGARSARGPFDFMSKAAYPQMSRNKPREANIFSMISRARGE